MAKIQLPKSLLDLPDKDREEILSVLKEASTLPKVKELPRAGGNEHNMWERNSDPLLAEVEDEFYQELRNPEAESLAELFVALGLPTEGIEKSFEDEFYVWEDELIKSKDSGRNRFSDWLKEVTKKKREQILKWATDGKALTKEQLQKIDRLLSSKLPDYAKKAEEFMVRAGFIGKIRGEAEREAFETFGAVVDRYPETIETAEKEGVALTVKQAKAEAKKTGKTIRILPLTKQESEAVKHAIHHAGDKITEISDRHRAGVRQLVIRAKKERWTAQQLAQALFDKFGEHNRDWRRVAITELAFATNDTYLSGCEEGDTLIGMGAVNACKKCQELIIGKQVTVTHKIPSEENYHTDTKLVWVGKSNYGRRVSEYVTAIPLHPQCRCRWTKVSRFYKLGEDGKLKLKTTAELINEERAKRGLPPDKTLQELEGLSDEERLKKLTEQFLAKQGG